MSVVSLVKCILIRESYIFDIIDFLILNSHPFKILNIQNSPHSKFSSSKFSSFQIVHIPNCLHPKSSSFQIVLIPHIENLAKKGNYQIHPLSYIKPKPCTTTSRTQQQYRCVPCRPTSHYDIYLLRLTRGDETLFEEPFLFLCN